MIVYLLLMVFFTFCLYYMLKNRLAIFFPSSKEVIDTVLEFADLKEGGVFYDLGSGDGRILIEVAKTHARVVGIEKNRFLNWVARKRTKNFENVRIIQGDIFDKDIKEANVLVAYLSRKLTHDLQKKIRKEAKKGTRIILIDHPFKDWKPIKMKRIGMIPVRLYVR